MWCFPPFNSCSLATKIKSQSRAMRRIEVNMNICVLYILKYSDLYQTSNIGLFVKIVTDLQQQYLKV